MHLPGSGEPALGPLTERFEGRVIGHYRVERLIGEGGMGVVYLARQDMPAREVALKVIRPGFSSEATLVRFRFEAEVLGRLQHPGIAQIYEAGVFDPPERRADGLPPVPFFAMEFVRGVDLRTFVQERSLGISERLTLIAEVCDAIEHAHTKGVIHRDLKPGNILVDQFGQPKVLDFGTARAVDADRNAAGPHTHAGQILGTIMYMSPEQVAGDGNVDTRSDVYSLGVVAFEILTGELPHDVRGRMMHQAMSMIRDQEPTRLSRFSRDFRGDVETIIATALEKNLSRRYQSAAALAADIRRHLRDEPILARPASATYQVRKFIKRNRILVGAAAGSVIVGVGAFTAVSVALASAIDAEQRANQSLQEAVSARAAESVLRLRAEEHQKRAEDEAETSRQVNAFMNEVLSSVNPDSGNRLITVREVLDRSAGRLDGAFEDRPSVRAQARLTIAQSYLGLGEPKEALRLATLAAEQIEKDAGVEDLRALAARAIVATAQQNLGDFDAAEVTFRQALARLERVDGALGQQTLTQKNNLAQVLAMQGKLEPAEVLLREAALGLKASSGEESGAYLDAAGNLAIVLQWRSRLDEAMELQKRVLELSRKIRGPEHPSTLIAINNMASLAAELGRAEDALAGYQEVLELSRKVLGKDHPDTIVSMSNVAGALTDLKRFEEAERLYREGLESRERLMGLSHPDTIQNIVDLGLNVEKQGRRAESVSLMRRAIEQGAGSDQDGPEKILATFQLGRLVMEEGNPVEAEPLLLDAEKRQLETSGESSWRLGAIRATLGMCLARLGRSEEAERSLTDGYAMLREQLGEAAFWTKKTAGALADVYLGRGDAGNERLWRGRSGAGQPAADASSEKK
jgi:eukaryotic-like serine/threonine-protein kinase